MLEEKEYDLYYSEEQAKCCIEWTQYYSEAYRVPSVVGPDGENIFYTECVEVGKKPTSKWNDYKFVGRATML